MEIPATPEALFEALGEPTLREVFPQFDQLKPRGQKLIKLLHTELTKGDLCDLTFQELTALVLMAWQGFNGAAFNARQEQIDSEDEIDTDWVDSAIHLGRIDQFVHGLLTQLHTMPGAEGESGSRQCENSFLLSGPGD